MDDLGDWSGALSGVARGGPEDSLLSPVRPSESGAAAFLGLGTSGANYWLKVLGNPQGDQVLATERVVTFAGALIGAPVRPIAVVEIGPELDGWEYTQLGYLSPSLAHGSLLLDRAEVYEDLAHRSRDDNARRQAFLIALWDWCMGEDPQWLYDIRDDHSIYTFDHGFWISGGEGDWSVESLVKTVDIPWAWRDGVSGIDGAALHDAADRLLQVTPYELLTVIACVPPSWGVADGTLEALAWFLYRRRAPVADRLRALAAHV